jgi:hypothetical protein
MATVKLTVQRGGREEKHVVVSAGAAEAQSDTMSLNIDVTNLRRGEVLLMLEALKQKIHASPTFLPS